MSNPRELNGLALNYVGRVNGIRYSILTLLIRNDFPEYQIMKSNKGRQRTAQQGTIIFGHFTTSHSFSLLDLPHLHFLFFLFISPFHNRQDAEWQRAVRSPRWLVERANSECSPSRCHSSRESTRATTVNILAVRSKQVLAGYSCECLLLLLWRHFGRDS